MTRCILHFFFVLVVALAASPLCHAQIDKFYPVLQPNLEVWKLTDEPARRHWINYHTTQAWSPDGRYVAIERSEPHTYLSGTQWIADPDTTDTFVFDFADEALVNLGRGTTPRWAKQSNRLFYIERDSGENHKVIRHDLESGQKTVMATGFVRLDETDSQDNWLYGRVVSSLATEAGNIFRIPLTGEGAPENINGEVPSGRIIIPNPVHAMMYYRNDTSGSFNGTRFYANLDGSNVEIAYPMLQRSHIAWSGDGAYLLQGQRQIFGRRWDEPFPSNLHILSIKNNGDPSGCGYDGRWVVGSGNYATMNMSDLRSGDSWTFLSIAGSYIHGSTSVDYSGGSFLMDNDAKCSPDGTKVLFVSNYNLKSGPNTKIVSYSEETATLNVFSTDGFPEQGRISAGNEVVGYTAKTPVSFTGITRNMMGTTNESVGGLTPEMIAAFRQRINDKEFLKQYPVTKEKLEQLKRVVGETSTRLRGQITSFESRLLPESVRGEPAPRFTDPEFPEPESDLIWQNQTDVFVAVTRQPGPPYLRLVDNRIELIPGEYHRETRGYYLLLNGVRLTPGLLGPGAIFTVANPGNLTAVAVEWSGLESQQSVVLSVSGNTSLDVLADKPNDFEWTVDRWLIAGQEVSAAEAQAAAASEREIVHYYDGLIHRESWQQNEKVTREDIAENGEAIRRLFYADGRLIRREYHGRGRGIRTTENFDAQGYIYEVIQHNKDGSVFSRTLLEQGTPVEHNGGALLIYGSGSYKKEGDAWIRTTKK